MRKLKYLVALFAVLTLSNCASIIKGRYQQVNLVSNTGKEAKVDVISASGQQTVTLPAIITVKRSGQSLSVSVKETQTVKPSTMVYSSKLEWFFLGNVVTGGVIGSTTDALTGAMWRYDDTIVVPLNTK
ncbi:MAG: hypothetical protein IJ853_01030 [Rickettsiales bacterium]|nr:hypothetical protein [Rickettsiales bacterium]